MNPKYRKTIIAGNWKMNKNAAETKTFFEEFKPLAAGCKWCEIVFCVPFTDIQTAVKSTRDSKAVIGAQNLHYAEKGAYTGEVTADMIKETGAKYVIIGHSERRQYYGETDKTVNLKLKTAHEAGLRPIVCVGESLEQREMGVTSEHIAYQVTAALSGLTPQQVRRTVIAYEPIWAIGTGKTATADQAEEVCAHIRSTIKALYGARVARAVTIQYGGSMNGGNAKELLSRADIDGGLIGGASLKPAEFIKIIEAAKIDE